MCVTFLPAQTMYPLKGGSAMSDLSEANSTLDNKFIRTPTETLEEMLRYSVFSEEALDVDETREILSELQRRESIPHSETPEEAWKIFMSEYSDTESDFMHCAYEENNQTSTRSNTSRNIRNIRAVVRIAIAAAIVIAVLFTGTVAAYALGFDLLGTIAQWGRETFGFRSTDIASMANDIIDSDFNKADVLPYNDLQSALTAHGVDDMVAPKWLPEGFELNELKVSTETSYQLFVTALYANNDRIISVRIALLFETPSTDYEKDENEVTVYERNGISHYLIANNGQNVTAWVNRYLECHISGDITQDELIKIIDSIYER